MTDKPDINAPEGFRPHTRKSRVTDPWEPLFSRVQNDVLQIGLRLDDAHCNSRGLVHGGVIAALADNAMGYSYVMAMMKAAGSDNKIGAVTISLQIDYASSAKLGQWLQIEPRIVKAGRSIGFVDALVTADGDTVARASASFKLLA
ncbi:PaaI family thioesterase [Parvularcula sp. IMCC14364]|uniref:PaaI family thioesterase n=1 Tax=Parvularcula sp. IMCC14364 TaxID=3067902 RepID=UPI00274099AE|nr:PaaI family thioesterase [Parvularcula sp. IMCC14364]